jgi:hypothetical protein
MRPEDTVCYARVTSDGLVVFLVKPCPFIGQLYSVLSRSELSRSVLSRSVGAGPCGAGPCWDKTDGFITEPPSATTGLRIIKVIAGCRKYYLRDKSHLNPNGYSFMADTAADTYE